MFTNSMERIKKASEKNIRRLKRQNLHCFLPSEIRNLQRPRTETLKRKLDKWLKTGPDETKAETIYYMCVATENNSTVRQRGGNGERCRLALPNGNISS